ncbi:MAG: hypothetical protein K9L31_02145 [Candidatus Pacebacteria bacterium]|nr:hypothetical protein [Candidatus Paceibacterota bacterium]
MLVEKSGKYESVTNKGGDFLIAAHANKESVVVFDGNGEAERVRLNNKEIKKKE